MHPTKDEIFQVCKQYDCIPVYTTQPYHGENIQDIYQTYRGAYSSLFELNSKEQKYSIIALPAASRLMSDGLQTTRITKQMTISKQESPYVAIEALRKKAAPTLPLPDIFTGGLLGHINYDAIRLQEYIPDNLPSMDLPMIHLCIAQHLVIIDHLNQLVYFITYLMLDTQVQSAISKAYEDCEQQLTQMQEQFQHRKKYQQQVIQTKECMSNMHEDTFYHMVEQAKQHIYEGDIFQIVLSQRFHCEFEQDPFQAYSRLREIGNTPYLYYFDFGDYVLAGASPELLLKANASDIMTMPIAGTRKRGSTRIEDEQLEQDLLHDPKELAEHHMLVDLGRNDIGKISSPSQVKVTQYKQIKRYSHVMHLCSEVHGTLLPGLKHTDALASLLPAGTLSGAPKIRAMQLIEELEPCKREVYGGSICLFDYRQITQCLITIRTILFHHQQAYVQAGAGIVKDSIPEKEYEETRHKAGMLLDALGCGGVL